MQLKTSHLFILFALGIALMNGENIRGTIDRGNEIRTERSIFRERIRRNRDEARNAEQLSKVALDRYRNNCIYVVDATTQKEGYFMDNALVIDSQLQRPLREGASICNSLGDTAIVQGGRISDIARVTVSDKPEFEQLITQRNPQSQQ